MNPRRSRPKQAWLDSEEGRIMTLMQKGLLSEALGKRLLDELKAREISTGRVVTDTKVNAPEF